MIAPGTPLPWKLEIQLQSAGKSRRFIRSRAAASGDIAAVLARGLIKRPVADANAAYIVHACNLYPELAKALSAMVWVFTDRPTNIGSDEEAEDQRQTVLAEARAVLAKAGAA